MKLDCRRCTWEQKIEDGCEKESPVQGRWKLDDWEFGRCPLKLVRLQSFEYIRAYNFYKEGYLPNPGGWAEQPVKLIEAIECIEKVVREGEKQEKKG